MTAQNVNTNKDVLKSIIKDVVTNLGVDEFTRLMKIIGQFDNKDRVDYFGSKSIGDAVCDANDNGFDVKLEINTLHDNYIYVKYDDEQCCIYGLGDYYEEWDEYFQYDTLVPLILDNQNAMNYLESCTGKCFNNPLYTKYESLRQELLNELSMINISADCEESVDSLYSKFKNNYQR